MKFTNILASELPAKAWPAQAIAVLIVMCALITFSCTKETVSPGGLVLFDFESDSDLDRFAWKCPSRFEISSDYSNTGKNSLRFEFHPPGRVGFSTGDVPHDWSVYKSLDFWIYNLSGSQVPLHLQINRREPNGKFNNLISTTIEAVPGQNKISIPLQARGEETAGRRGKLEKVDGFYIFMREISEVKVLHFDSFKLANPT